jgi:ABC-type glutathione transport system ATPase component
MTPILQTEHAAVRYARHGPMVVEDFNVALEAQGAVGLVGESGSGKTTAARMLLGMVDPVEGNVTVQGRSWSQVGAGDPLRRTVQVVFQDPYGALNPRMTAEDAVAEPIRRWEKVSRPAAKELARELLAETGLSRHSMSSRPRELSGGQCQRVSIARALACRPAVLIADEPTSALDVSVQAQILNLLIRLRETHELALLLISHDLAVVRYITDEVLVMSEGKVVERGPTEDVFDDPWHPYTQLLIASSAPGAGLQADARALACRCVSAGRHGGGSHRVGARWVKCSDSAELAIPRA